MRGRERLRLSPFGTGNPPHGACGGSYVRRLFLRGNGDPSHGACEGSSRGLGARRSGRFFCLPYSTAAVSDQDPTLVILTLIVLFGSIALHEFGHAKSADAAGDPTPRLFGRVTLNPIAHFEPLGAMMIVILSISGFGIGWGKPVMTNPTKMQNPKWDGFMSVLWGPLTNVIIAVVFALVFRFIAPSVPAESVPILFCKLTVLINISLALFNLLPIGPLDGHWLLGFLLPQPMGARFIQWSHRQGTMLLFAVILIDNFVFRTQGQPGILGTLLFGPATNLTRLLLGI